jgi:DNA helicase IV
MHDEFDRVSPEDRAVIDRHLRVCEALAHVPIERSTPYFARLVVRPSRGGTASGPPREVFLAEKSLNVGDVVLIHWRDAPLAEVFYTAVPGDGYEIERDGLELHGEVLARESVEFVDGELAAILFDGRSLVRTTHGWSARQREKVVLPKRPPEERRRGVQSIEAQLDVAQRAIVEYPPNESVLLIGEAGFGKTTVALARLAHLARLKPQSTVQAAGDANAAKAEQPDTESAFRSLVVVPNAALQSLCRHWLARMDVKGVEVSTFESWIARQGRRVFPECPKRFSVEVPAAVARIKRHPGLLPILPQIVQGTETMRLLQEREDRPSTPWEWIYHLFGDRELLSPLLKEPHFPLRQREIEEVARHTREQFMPTTEAFYRDVDAEKLKTLDGLRIDERTPDQNAGTMDIEDVPVIFAIHHLVNRSDKSPHGQLDRYDHIVIDEGQEFATIELELLGRALKQDGSLTLAGDAQQQVDESAYFESWDRHLLALGQSDARRETLLVSYRCPPPIEALARSILARSQAETGPAIEGLAVEPARLSWIAAANPCAWQDELLSLLTQVRSDDPQATIAVILRYEASARLFYDHFAEFLPIRLCLAGDFDFRPGIKITCVPEVKGLEFDYVIIPDLDRSTYSDTPLSARALYVAVTRAKFAVALAWTGKVSSIVAAHVPA